MAQEYNFLTPWRFDTTTIFEVADVLEDTASLPRWWPDLFKSVAIVKPGGVHAIDQVAYCCCRARLPYTLRFTYTVVEQRYPYGSTLKSEGDLVGTGIWRLAERALGV